MKGIFIFVYDRGFVSVGRAEIHEELVHFWHLPQSRTIRQWGTSKGLAELKDGPTSSTVLDEICERSIPFRSVIEIIHLTEKGVKEWSRVL